MPLINLSDYEGVFTLAEISAQVRMSFPYDSFFPGQKEAIIEIVDAFMNKGKRHVVLEAPTGVGKTVVASTVHRTIAALVGGRKFVTTVTTTTKGLQHQYEKETNTYDLKGKTNYTCPMGCSHYNTLECRSLVKAKGCKPAVQCPYVSRRIVWTDSTEWRCTNTAMFVEMCPILCMKPDNMADLVIFDECHKLPETLVEHTQVDLNPDILLPLNSFYGRVHETYSLALKLTKDIEKLFAGQVGKLVSFPEYLVGEVNELNEGLNDFLEIVNTKLGIEGELSPSARDLCFRLIESCQKWSDVCEIITDCGVRDFIVREMDGKHVLLKPVNVTDVSEYGAFRKGNYFLHMSATICGLDAYAELMGIDPAELHTIEMEHPIDVERRMVNYVPVVKMSGGAPDENKLVKMINAIDDIIVSPDHANQNGIIHTASYKLAEDLMKRSRHKRKMMIGRDRTEIMKVLKLNAEQGTQVIVLSPALIEGYDLKHNLARWQVIAKVPFGYLGDPVVKYISDKHPGAYMRDTCLSVVQAAGRVTRGPDDHGVTYILDEAFQMVLARGHKFLPPWFLDALAEF